MPSAANVGRYGSQRRVGPDVLHPDRLRVRAVGPPRRVTLHRAPVGIRQTAVGLEAHHPVGVEEQDRRPADPEPRAQRVERRLVDLVHRPALADGLGQGETSGDVIGGGIGRHDLSSRPDIVVNRSSSAQRLPTLPCLKLRTKPGRGTLLFQAPIWQNIAYGRPEANRDAIVRAAELANAHEFITDTGDHPRRRHDLRGEGSPARRAGHSCGAAGSRGILCRAARDPVRHGRSGGEVSRGNVAAHPAD